jgi:iron complex outermembrane receptor protein
MTMRSKIATMSVRLALWGAASLAIQAGAAAAQTQTVNLNIPAQDLGRALNTFARQSNQQLLYSPDLVRGRRAPALAGNYAPDQALRKLLNDSGISVSRTANGAFVLAAAQPAPAEAQPSRPPRQVAAPSGKKDEEEEIVVTGTLIRNTAPTGTDPITVGKEKIEGLGATRSSEVLAAIPQIQNNFFNGIPQTEAINATATGGFNQTTNRPSLRPNPFGSTDSGNSTLILFDGAREAGIGVNGSSANPDAVPPALLERVEVNPDGGSATYGSDAIGGVINFITRKRYDGVLVGGSVGHADNYTTWEANAVAGTEWGSGGAYIGYSFSKNDILLNGQRDFFQPLDFATGLARGLSCDTANIQIAAVTGGPPIHYYAVPATGAPITPSFTVIPPLTGTPNVCTLEEQATMASANEQHNVLARLTQDISDNIAVGLRLHFNDQQQHGLTAPRTFSATINNTNPFFRPIPAAAGADSARTSYTVLGNFGDFLGPDERTFANSSRTWGALADLTWTLGKWRFYGFANYDHSKSDYDNPGVNATAINNAFNGTVNGAPSTCTLQPSTANCLNPFDIGASNPALLANIASWVNIGRGTDSILNFRGVFDGPLFELPGGPVQVAVGAEYLRDKFAKGILLGPDPNALVKAHVSQSNWSLFGEINIPVFSERNAIPLFRELRLTAAGRYDHYSTVGGTFNPKLGASWKPVEFLTLRGNWSKTFRAPTTVDLIGTFKSNAIINQFPACVFGCFAVDPSRPLPGNNDVFLGLQGTDPGVTPQKGRNWSVGADLMAFRKRFRASVTYYRIDYLDLLANPFNGTPVFPNLAFLVQLCPGTPGAYACTPQQIAAFTSQASVNNSTAAVNNIYGLYDIRTRNLGNARVGGLDWQLNFNQPTSWGSFYLDASGSWLLKDEAQSLPGQPFVNVIAVGGGNVGAFNLGRSLARITVRAGVNVHDFRAQATLNHNAGYDVIRSATLLQDRVKSFNVLNLFFSYEFKKPGTILNGLELSLNVNNVFNTDPPVELRTNSGNGFINGQTLGRLIRFGIQKKFGVK